MGWILSSPQKGKWKFESQIALNGTLLGDGIFIEVIQFIRLGPNPMWLVFL